MMLRDAPSAAPSLAGLFRACDTRTSLVSLDYGPLSYRDLWSNACRLARTWRAEGLRPGDTLALVFPNGAALPCCYLACAIGGYVACPIPDTHHPDLIRQLLARVLPRHILRTAPTLVAGLAPEKGDDEVCLDHDRPFLILFTSGSTGEPKPMLHRLGSILGRAASFARLTGMTPDTRLLHVLPMAYMAGILNAFFAPLVAGATLVEGPLFSPANMATFWDIPLRHGVNALSLTPTMAAALCRITRDADILQQVRAQLTQVQCTSAPIHDSLRQQFLDHFGLPLQNCYGMTEVGGPLTFQQIDDARAHRDFGEPVDDIDCSLRGEHHDELWIRTPNGMLGYLVEGALSSATDADGYLDTGDIAAIEDGKLQIRGRKKDVIIRGGINLSPLRIETVLSRAPGVDDIVVLGVAHAFWGEMIVACIVASPGAPNAAAQLLAYAREHLSAHERPDKVVVLDQLPRSFIGKLQRDALRRQLLAEHLLPEQAP